MLQVKCLKPNLVKKIGGESMNRTHFLKNQNSLSMKSKLGLFILLFSFSNISCLNSKSSFPNKSSDSYSEYSNGNQNLNDISLSGDNISIRPRVIKAGSGCANHECIWLIAERIHEDAYVDLRQDAAGPIVAQISNRDLSLQTNNSTVEVTFRVPPGLLPTFSQSGLWVAIVNPQNSQFTPLYFVKRVPTDDLGLYTSYVPYNQRVYGQLVRWPSRLAMSQWATNPYSNDRLLVTWGNPARWTNETVEEHGLRTCGSRQWWWLYAYRNDEIGHRYKVDTTKALLVKEGVEYDITREVVNCSRSDLGQPYFLNQIERTPYVMKVWGNIYNYLGDKDNEYYWQHTVVYKASEHNPCWQGSGSSSRPVILQEEAWWDRTTGWQLGNGNVDAEGRPTGENVWYSAYQTIARGVGFVWTAGRRDHPDQDYSLECLSHQQSWQ